MCMTVPRPNIDTGCLPQLFSLFIFFWDRVSCWIWGSWVLLSCLANELQESLCLQATRHPRMDYRNHIAVPDFLHLSSADSDSAPRVCLASMLQKASSPQPWLGSSCPVGLCFFLYSSVVESVSQASRYHVGKENNARSPPLQGWLWRTRLNSGPIQAAHGFNGVGYSAVFCSHQWLDDKGGSWRVRFHGHCHSQERQCYSSARWQENVCPRNGIWVFALNSVPLKEKSQSLVMWPQKTKSWQLL